MKHFKNQVFFERNPAKFLKSAEMFPDRKQLCVFGSPAPFFRQKVPAGDPGGRVGTAFCRVYFSVSYFMAESTFFIVAIGCSPGFMRKTRCGFALTKSIVRRPESLPEAMLTRSRSISFG